jgi:hypothetical protein
MSNHPILGGTLTPDAISVIVPKKNIGIANKIPNPVADNIRQMITNNSQATIFIPGSTN